MSVETGSERFAPTDVFWSSHYLRHNQRRLEHLASLGLPLDSQTVLEVGAGIGDHTSFFLDRQCSVVVAEAQEQNIEILRSRYPELRICQLDLNRPPHDVIEADIVHCYGVLYHLEYPAQAIAWLARCATKLLLLETCVAASDDCAVYPFHEPSGRPENAPTGRGCRPTRRWVKRELLSCFAHAYMPVTQPWHEEFPLDWSDPKLLERSLIRAVFIASHSSIDSRILTEQLPMKQVREPREANWATMDGRPPDLSGAAP